MHECEQRLVHLVLVTYAPNTAGSVLPRRGGRNRHKRVVDGNNKDLAGMLELGGVDVAGNMALRAGGGEGSGDAWGGSR